MNRFFRLMIGIAGFFSFFTVQAKPFFPISTITQTAQLVQGVNNNALESRQSTVIMPYIAISAESDTNNYQIIRSSLQFIRTEQIPIASSIFTTVYLNFDVYYDHLSKEYCYSNGKDIVARVTQTGRFFIGGFLNWICKVNSIKQTSSDSENPVFEIYASAILGNDYSSYSFQIYVRYNVKDRHYSVSKNRM